LQGQALATATTGNIYPNQTTAVTEYLAADKKTLVAGDSQLDPGRIAGLLGAQAVRQMATAELVRAFARRTDLPIVLDQGQMLGLVLAGVRNGVWEYQDPMRGIEGWATKSTPDRPVRIAEDTYIHPVGSAPAPAPSLPPEPLSPPPAVKASFVDEGKADVAFTQVRQQAADAKVDRVVSLVISIDLFGDSTGTELAKLLSVIPAGTAGSLFAGPLLRYQVSAQIELGAPGNSLEVQFSGPASEYTPLKSALDHMLRSKPAILRASVTARFDPPVPLAGHEIEEIGQHAADTGPAKCQIGLEPVRE
jgi:hypothetical protein